ncbi:hypothetical protein LTR28_002574, partial [Elasticomyces elasticus]
PAKKLQEDDDEIEGLRHTLRGRGTSISFSSHAKLDDGREHAVDEPLPKAEPIPACPRGRHAAEHDGQDQQSHTYRTNPFTGEKIRRHSRQSAAGKSRPRVVSYHPRDLDDSAAFDQAASLPSESTVTTDGVRTPLSPTGSFLLSPVSVSSPLFSPRTDASPPWPFAPYSSTKRVQSLRPTSRRSSVRSASSVKSPASAFLSNFGRASTDVAPEPDDEGQAIGYERQYIIGRTLACGGFSVVKEVFSMDGQNKKIRRAVKIVRKQVAGKDERTNEKAQQEIDHEISIWRFVRHPHILPLHEVYDTAFAQFCVMDLNIGGTLHDL